MTSLMTHILTFDVRRHRWLIAAWVVVTAATVSLQGWAPFLDHGRREMRAVQLAITLGWFAQLLVALILLPLVVHTHSAVGTTAFWMTRPFPPGMLARSKVLLLSLLFVVVPALCDALMMAFYTVPAAHILAAVLDAALQRAAILSLVLTVAVLTPNFARFAIAIGAVAVASIAAINLWIALSMILSDDMVGYAVLTTNYQVSYPNDFGADPTPDVLAALLAIALGVTVAILQYRTRATRRTATIAVIGFVLVTAIGLAWPWPLLQARTEAPDWTADVSRARLVGSKSIVHVEHGPEMDTPSRWRVGRGYAFMEGVPAGWIATTRLKSATVTTVSGEQIQSRGIGYAAVLNASNETGTPLHTTLKALIGADIIAAGGLDSSQTLVVFAAYGQPQLDREFIGSYRGEFAVDLAELSVAAVLPLKAPATFKAGALKLTLLETRWHEQGVRVRFRISDVRHGRFDGSPDTNYEFYLRSSSRRQAVEGQHMSGGWWITPEFGWSGVHLAPASSFYADTRELFFSSNTYGRFFAVNVDKSWMNDAELMIVRRRQAGSITRTLEVPQWRFVPSN